MLGPLIGAGIAAVVVIAAVAVLWPKLRAKPATPPPVAVAAQPAPVAPPAVSPPPAQPVAPKPAAPQTPAAAPPVPAGMTGVLPGIELEGGTYRLCGGNDATPENCRAACRADSQCVAWDYARPGVISSDARRFLENKPTFQVSSPCCIAGIERPQAQ